MELKYILIILIIFIIVISVFFIIYSNVKKRESYKRNSKDNYVVYPEAGLCNKLRVTFSYNKYCIENNKNLIVIWDVTQECPGYFLDYFKEIDGIDFYKNNDKNFKIDYRGGAVHPAYNPYDNFVYDKLQLKPRLEKQIKNNILKLGNNYISAHIRRTDHLSMAKSQNRYFDDNEYIDFINSNDNYNLYIATDNKKTQDLFYDKYKNKIKVYKQIKESNKLRQTDLKTAIIDIFMCVYSKKFMGSGYSSYTDLIDQLRSKVHNTKIHNQDFYLKEKFHSNISEIKYLNIEYSWTSYFKIKQELLLNILRQQNKNLSIDGINIESYCKSFNLDLTFKNNILYIFDELSYAHLLVTYSNGDNSYKKLFKKFLK